MNQKSEAKTLEKMISYYCVKKHGTKKTQLCKECSELLRYASNKLENCPHGKNKPVCSKCSIHCYETEMRKRIKNVMKYSGPRMVFISPELFIRYLYRKIFC